MTAGDASTRRGFLSAVATATAAGAVALAGCGEIGSGAAETPDPILAGELPNVSRFEDTTPVLEDDLPVGIESDRLRGSADRVTGLLGTLPLPLEPADVPNGHVRRQLREAAEAATDGLDAARSATTGLAALNALRRGRAEARYAAEGWAFVAEGRTAAELRAEQSEVAADAEALRSAQEYRGDDRIRAVVLHAYVEEFTRRALDDRGRSAEAGRLLTVAEWGERAESARAYLEDARYVRDRFEASLPPTAESFEGTFADAAETLHAELSRRRDALPPEPDNEGAVGSAERLRGRLRRNAVQRAENAPDPDRPAGAVVEAVAGLADFGAYDRLRGRIEDGERFEVEAGADVREFRSAAIESVSAALEASPRPTLARRVLADAARSIAYGDDEVARYRGSVRPNRLDDPVRRYVAATVRARSVPAACEDVIDALYE